MKTIDRELWTPFINLWTEAADAGLSVEELAELSGVNSRTLCSRQFTLRARGVMLPLLRGQRGPRKPSKKRQAVRPVAAAPKCSVEPLVIYVM